MSDGGGKFTVLSDELHDDIVANGAREDAALARSARAPLRSARSLRCRSRPIRVRC